MPTTANSLTPVTHINRIPDHELTGNLLIGSIVSPLERGQGAIRKDNAPAIGHIGGVALDKRNIVSRMSFFDQEARVETRRTSPKNDNFQTDLLHSPFQSIPYSFSPSSQPIENISQPF